MVSNLFKLAHRLKNTGKKEETDCLIWHLNLFGDQMRPYDVIHFLTWRHSFHNITSSCFLERQCFDSSQLMTSDAGRCTVEKFVFRVKVFPRPNSISQPRQPVLKAVKSHDGDRGSKHKGHAQTYKDIQIVSSFRIHKALFICLQMSGFTREFNIEDQCKN